MIPRRPGTSITRFLRNPFNAAVVILVLIIVITGLIWAKQHSGGFSGDMAFSSPSVKTGEKLPAQFTCDGDNISPEFSISNIPAKAKSLALLVEDKNLDSKTYKDNPFQAHWMVWNIPVTTSHITQGIRPPGTVGRNLFGNFAYGGPCPPEGQTHHYIITLYALNVERINKTSDNGLNDIKKTILKYDIGKSELAVTYTKARSKDR